MIPDPYNPNIPSAKQPDVKPGPLAAKRNHLWEIAGFFAMLGALLAAFAYGGLQWAVFWLLLAIYCAAMR